MSGGVTTGSILNARASRPARGGTGVKPSALMQTRVTLANRTSVSGRTSYTALSRSINGRAVIVNAGGCHKCSGSSSMSTMEKIAMWNAITQSSLQLTQTIASMFKTDKSGDTQGAGKPKGSDGAAGAGKNIKASDVAQLNQLYTQSGIGKNPGVDNSSSILNTLSDYGLPDVALNDIDYQATANDLIHNMNHAKTSADLYKNLTSARAYKQQIKQRKAQIDTGSLESKLSTLKGEADGSIKKAKDNLSSAEKAFDSAKDDVTKGKTQLQSERAAYDKTVYALKDCGKEVDNAKENVTTKTDAYDKSSKLLSDARSNYSKAQIVTREATNSYETAKVNTAEAKANYEALLRQQGSKTDGSSLQSQISEAKAKWDSAKQAEEAAKKAKESAEQDENDAKTKLGDSGSGAVQAFNNAKAELTQARSDLNAAVKKWAGTDKAKNDVYSQLNSAEDSVNTFENTLAEREETFATRKDELTKAQDNVADLEAEKEKIEMQLHDYKEMQSALDKLDDLDSYQTKLKQMMKKENTTYESLTQARDSADDVSNDSELSANKNKKGAKTQKKLQDKISNLLAGNAGLAMANDAEIQVTNALDKMQSDAHVASMTLPTLVNGHMVSMTGNTFTVDYKEGLSRADAEAMLLQQSIKVGQ